MNEPGIANASDVTDAELLARLQSAGTREREVRAPDALQARLEASYLRVLKGRRFALFVMLPRSGIGMRWSALARLPAYTAACAACVALVVVWFGIGQSPAQQQVALPAAAGTPVAAETPVASQAPVPAGHAAPVRVGSKVAADDVAPERVAAPSAAVVVVSAPAAQARRVRVRDSTRAVAAMRSDVQQRAWQMPIVAKGITTSIPAVALRPPAVSTHLTTLAALNLSALPTYAPTLGPAPAGAAGQAEPVDVHTGDPTRSMQSEPGADPEDRPAADAWPDQSVHAVVGLLV